MIVLQCARQASKETGKRIPWWKIYIVPGGLVISTSLFFSAYGVAQSSYGKTDEGAKIKFIHWGVGFLVEGASYILVSRFGLGWPGPDGSSGDGTGTDTQICADTIIGTQPVHLILEYQLVTPQVVPLKIPYSGVKTRERLEAITTIILGEVSSYVMALVQGNV